MGFKPGDPALTIPLPAGRERGPKIDHPVAHAVLLNVLYPARYARDRRLGITGRKYALIPPDPWLVALGLVMWEGIVQGLSWDTVKTAVSTALDKMRRSNAAPVDTSSTKIKRELRLGFHWTDYVDGEKQREMFFGLRRKYKQESRSVAKKANPAPKGTHRKRRAP